MISEKIKSNFCNVTRLNVCRHLTFTILAEVQPNCRHGKRLELSNIVHTEWNSRRREFRASVKELKIGSKSNVTSNSLHV